MRTALALAFALVLTLASTPHLAAADPCTTGPSQFAGFLGGGVTAAVRIGSKIYVAGSFNSVNALPVTNVVQWDGVSWSSVGGGIPGTVLSLVADASGNLYAAGGFSEAGGTSASNVARWDGTSWSALGAGTDGIIHAMAMDAAGNLYVGGYITTAGGTSVSNVAKWDGSTWSALGAGTDSPVESLLTDAGGNLYVGGGFLTADGVTVNGIAKWNGTAFTAFDVGVRTEMGQGPYGTVMALAFDGSGNLYAGGLFDHAGSAAAKGIAKWDGAAWSGFGLGVEINYVNPGQTRAIAFDASGNLYAGGYFQYAGGLPAPGLAKWNGTTWTAFVPTLDNPNYPGVPIVSTLFFDPSNTMYFGGSFISDGTLAVGNFAAWDGTTVSGVGLDAGARGILSFCSPYGGSPRTVAVGPNDDVYVAGTFDVAGDARAHSVAKWDGSSWSGLGTPPFTNCAILSAVVADAAGNVYVGGRDTQYTNSAQVVRFDGSTWTTIGTANADVSSFVLDSTGTNLYVGGYFSNLGTPATGIARWNGTTWSALGSGPGFLVRALAIDADDHVYAAGSTNFGANLVAEWNGSSWSNLGAGMDNGIAALETDTQGNLYASGAFTMADGVPANRVARWNGSAWSPLGAGPASPYPGAMAIDAAGNVFVSSFEKWNGTSWSSISGGGFDQPVLDIALDSANNLYAVGGFSTRSGIPTQRFAIRTCDACGNGLADPGEQCDDAELNGTLDSCCAATCAVANDGTACNDGDTCTPTDQCMAGTCVGSGDTCNVGCCSVHPGTGCQLPLCSFDVCERDPFCCSTTWDELCVREAGDHEPNCPACAPPVCPGGSTDPADCRDTMMCYKAKATHGTPAFAGAEQHPLDVADRTLPVDIGKATDLCVPAHAPSGTLLDGALHYESYATKGGYLFAYTITDRFGTWHVIPGKAARTLVPTHTMLDAAATPPPNGSADEYLCVKFKVQEKLAKGLTVTLSEAFESDRTYEVKKAQLLCGPAHEPSDRFVNPLMYLMCYQVKIAKGQPKHVPVVGRIHTANRLSSGQLDTSKQSLLCVPAKRAD